MGEMENLKPECPAYKIAGYKNIKDPGTNGVLKT